MNILIVGNEFYDYQNGIIECLKEKGYEADFISLDYKRNLMSRIVNKLIGKYLYNRNDLNKLYKHIQNNNYDVLFVIVGNTISKSFLKKINNKKIIKILYLWDDIKRVPNYKKNVSFYDYVFTFDKNDSINYDLEYYPLFHRGGNSIQEKDIDLLFIGWLHSDRLKILKQIYEDNLDLKCYFKVFLNKSQLKYLKKDIPNEWLLKKTINNEELINLMKRSKGIVDINFPSQKGLTIRTIESLPYNLKIFTTNSEIKSYDFYKEEMISIIDRSNPLIDRKVLDNNGKYDSLIIQKYSLDNWVDNVIIKNLGDK